jgi:putative phosphoesterase
VKLGLLGDIHGNSLALRAVLEAAHRESVEALCVTGDYVGYYYHPREVLDLLDGWQTWRVRGNHEDMLASVLADPSGLEAVEARYGHGLRRAIEQLTVAELTALTSLPASERIEIEGRRIVLAHGTPWDVDTYVYPDANEDIFSRLGEIDADLVILGHTHYRMQRRIGSLEVANPGSVGQPRDRILGAAWAAYDTTTGMCEQFIEVYDITAVQAEARAIDPGLPYLHDVLARR